MTPKGSSLVCRFHMDQLWLFQAIYNSMYFESDITQFTEAVTGWFKHEPSKPANESWFKGGAQDTVNQAAEFVDSSAESQPEVDLIPRSSTREDRKITLDCMNERFDEAWTLTIIMRHALEYVYCDATGFAASVPD